MVWQMGEYFNVEYICNTVISGVEEMEFTESRKTQCCLEGAEIDRVT